MNNTHVTTNTTPATPATPVTPSIAELISLGKGAALGERVLEIARAAIRPGETLEAYTGFVDNVLWAWDNLGGTFEDAYRLLEIPEARALVEEAEEFTTGLRSILRGYQRQLGIPGDVRSDLEAYLREELELDSIEVDKVLEAIPEDKLRVPRTLEQREHLWDIVSAIPNIRPIIGPDSVFLGDRLSRGGTTGDLERAVLRAKSWATNKRVGWQKFEELLEAFNPWRRAYGRGLWYAIQREPSGVVFEETVWKAFRSVLCQTFGWDVEVSSVAIEILRKFGSAAEVYREVFTEPFGVITLGLWVEAERALRKVGRWLTSQNYSTPFRFEGSPRVMDDYIILSVERPEEEGGGIKPEAAKRHPANVFLRKIPTGLFLGGAVQVALPKVPNTEVGAQVRRQSLLQEAVGTLKGLLEQNHWLALPPNMWDSVLVGGLTPFSKTTHGDLLCSHLEGFLEGNLRCRYEILLQRMGSVINTTLMLEYPEEDSVEPMVVYHRDLWKLLAGTSKPTKQSLRKFAQDRLGIKLPSSGGKLTKVLTAIKGQVYGLDTKFPAEDFERQVRWGDEDGAREFFLEAYTNYPSSRSGFDCISPGVMGSCMRYDSFNSWRGYSIGASKECDFDHPVVAYLTEDIGLVRVVHKPTGYIVARALINGKRRAEGRKPTLCRIYSVGFSRVPLTEQSLSPRENNLWQDELLGVLKGSEGWATKQTYGLEGCRMVPQEIQEGVIVAPYIDGQAVWLTENSDGSYTVDTCGDYECFQVNPPVVLEDSSRRYCQRCEESYHEDDMVPVVVNSFGDIQYWCDNCAESCSLYCVRCSQRFSENVSGFNTDHDLCEECFAAAAETCPSCEELIHQDDFDDTPVMWNTYENSRVPECLCDGCMRHATITPCICCGENCLPEVLNDEGLCQWCAEEAADEESMGD